MSHAADPTVHRLTARLHELQARALDTLARLMERGSLDDEPPSATQARADRVALAAAKTLLQVRLPAPTRAASPPSNPSNPSSRPQSADRRPSSSSRGPVTTLPPRNHAPRRRN